MIKRFYRFMMCGPILSIVSEKYWNTFDAKKKLFWWRAGTFVMKQGGMFDKSGPKKRCLSCNGRGEYLAHGAVVIESFQCEDCKGTGYDKL